MKNIFILLAILLTIYSCVPVTPPSSANQKRLLYTNLDYEPFVGMTKLYPAVSSDLATLEYPVVALNQNGLILEFDLLEENYRAIGAKYIHCNADWTKSNLTDLQFLNTYNEFQINDYQYSQNTKVPYVKYEKLLPPPLKSGNYLLVVYDQNNVNDILFTRRFMVYERRAQIDARVLQSSIVSKRRENQQVEFSISYKGIVNTNPLQDFKVVILQNHNWNMALAGLQPTLMRTDQQYLEYRHFNGENNFPGLNEFRFFDLRTVDFNGMHVTRINKETPGMIEAFVGADKPRAPQAYAQLNNDINGNYYLQNNDPTDSQLMSEYVDVNFQLIAPPIDGDIYLGCMATNWHFNANTKLQFVQETQSYQGNLRLKQGYYDYFYWVVSDDLPIYAIEGSFWQTINKYEILFYYRSPANDYDELIGYAEISSGN